MATTHPDHIVSVLTKVVSRRGALHGLGGAGLATLGLAATGRAGAAQQARGTAPIEPNAGTWKTWILASGDELRPEAPPDEAATNAERAELRALVTGRDAVVLDRISYWDAGSPGYRWNELAMQQTQRATMGPGDA